MPDEILARLMVRQFNHRQDYDRYLKGNGFKCVDSPTGAHYWIVGNQSVCKYCRAVKVPTSTHPQGGTILR